MGLLVIVASLGLFMSMETLRGGSFRNDRNTAVSALQRARSLAINNMCFGDCDNGKPHGVHFNSDGVIIFQGENYTAGESENETIDFDSKTTTVDASKINNGNIIFKQLSGDLLDASSSSVIIGDGMGHSSEIKVNSEGQIDWTN